MPLKSAFERRSWEKYPVYLSDEKHDNLDDEPNQPRNTTKTLADELAAVCRTEEDIQFLEESCSPESTGPTLGFGSRDPRKRAKARIGKRFLKKDVSMPIDVLGGSENLNLDSSSNSDSEKGGSGTNKATNDSGLQVAVPQHASLMKQDARKQQAPTTDPTWLFSNISF